jgi:Tfp pilus assembly protein PilN
MSRILNQREKRLLFGCIAVILLATTALAYGWFEKQRKVLNTAIEALTEQTQENEEWLNQRGRWDKRMKWLEAKMPYTDSAGRSQGQLLEELQTSALDAELKITGQTLLEPLALDHANEVAVNIKLRGDQDKMLRWLLVLQAPEKFQAMKAFELELDTKAKEKTPQAQCNLTIARWFNPNPPEEGAAKPES